MLTKNPEADHIKQIIQLYEKHDLSGCNNVVELLPPLRPNDLSLIDSLTAFLEHPKYRQITLPLLEELLEKVSKQILD